MKPEFKDLSTKEIAQAIRKRFKEEFKDYKISVTKESYSGGSSITISVMESPIIMKKKPEEITPEAKRFYEEMSHREPDALKKMQSGEYHQLNNYSLCDEYDTNKWCNGVFLTEAGHKALRRMVEISREYNYDNSDPQSDYFDVNYYLHIQLGKWDKPFMEAKQ
ncbi:MAG: hypothetical protein GY861_17340 [bacterium]|nr:hypothetical protein [bacterium]